MKNIISVVGGLGNQMFQYAFSLTLEKKDETSLNDYLARNGQSNYGSELKNVFGINLKNNQFDNFLVWYIRKCIVFACKSNTPVFYIFLIKMLRILGIVVKSDYLPELMKDNKIRCLKSIWYGRFQNEAFFKTHEEEVREKFSFDLSLASERTREIAKVIEQKNSISFHVRRGDYLSPSNASTFGNICTLEYYQKTIQFILETVEKPVFFVFSDDIQWVKENLKFPGEIYYIDWNTGNSSWEDMYLMSICKHNIIANSTFSWWGAWLNKNPKKKVLCPPKYTNTEEYTDLFPDTWTKIYT